jgi:hypothetical protein
MVPPGLVSRHRAILVIGGGRDVPADPMPGDVSVTSGQWTGLPSPAGVVRRSGSWGPPKDRTPWSAGSLVLVREESCPVRGCSSGSGIGPGDRGLGAARQREVGAAAVVDRRGGPDGQHRVGIGRP